MPFIHREPPSRSCVTARRMRIDFHTSLLRVAVNVVIAGDDKQAVGLDVDLFEQRV